MDNAMTATSRTEGGSNNLKGIQPSYTRSPLPPSHLPPNPTLNRSVRPAPPRQGQPASSRNFAASSAGGAISHLSTSQPTQPRSNHTQRESTEQPNGRRNVGKGPEEALSQEQKNKLEWWGASYAPSEETIRNDYSSQYVQTGQRPQNYLRNTAVDTRFSEYPKLASLLAQKHALTASSRHSIPPTYLNIPSTSHQTDETGPSAIAQALSTIQPFRFDCILLTPPPHITFSELSSLNLGQAASNPGFVWLWVGSGQTKMDGSTDGIGLERGRELLASWGYRRCEDIVWLRTNHHDPEGDLTREPDSLFTPTIEHCLMGIRGTVRRSTDSWFVHCNVDTDVIVWEGDSDDPDLKPPELQTLIENFCLGTRRLHLYGSRNALRRGWCTISSEPEMYSGGESRVVHPVENEEGAEEWIVKPWTKEGWEEMWSDSKGMNGGDGGAKEEGEKVKVESLMPFVEELDSLRPKSPPPRNGLPSSGGLGRGRGAGLGITRSGLVNQSSTRGPPSGTNGYPAPSRNGLGRGRGRGSGPSTPNLAPPPNGSSLPPPFAPQPMSQPTLYHSNASDSSPYRQHSQAQLAPPVPQMPPSRPLFNSQHSSYSSSSHPSQRYSNRQQHSQPKMQQAPSFLGPAQHQQHQQNFNHSYGGPGFAPPQQQNYQQPSSPYSMMQPHPHQPSQYGHSPQFIPPPQQLAPPSNNFYPNPQYPYQQSHQLYQAPPPQLNHQFSQLSLSSSSSGSNGLYIPQPPQSQYSPSPTPSPSLASMHLPVRPPAFLSHSSSMNSIRSIGTSSTNSSFVNGGGYGNGSSIGWTGAMYGVGHDGELEYPIGGPSRRASEQGI